MTDSTQIEAIAHVVGGRREVADDYWGGVEAIIRIDHPDFGPDSTKGLEEFSHLEIVWGFHLVDRTDLDLGPRRPRNNPEWPEVGPFGHRNMRKKNWLGVSRCKLLKVDGLDLHVMDLDAVDGSPVYDIKPWFIDFGPRGEIHQADWTTEMLKDYYAPAKPV